MPKYLTSVFDVEFFLFFLLSCTFSAVFKYRRLSVSLVDITDRRNVPAYICSTGINKYVDIVHDTTYIHQSFIFVDGLEPSPNAIIIPLCFFFLFSISLSGLPTHFLKRVPNLGAKYETLNRCGGTNVDLTH